MTSEPIAIVGMAGRFPEARSIDELHANLRAGRDSVRKISPERIQSTSLHASRSFREIGYLEDIDRFDHRYFQITRGEAEVMDPNHRLLLEVVHHAIENAGYAPSRLRGSNTSVYIADIFPEYYKLADEFVDSMVSGNSPAFLATRITRHFGWVGNALLVDTACSSSLVALHMACNDLRARESDMAIVAGSNIQLFPYVDKKMEFNIWSSDGRSRAFSARADGMSCAEVVIALLIRPLHKALEAGDHIHAIIRGSAVNNNAERSASPSAPDGKSQADVLAEAWRRAGVNPRDIELIEAHGSGTQLGDSLEVEGMTNAFARSTPDKGFCSISTIKSSIGHGYNAAGLAGLTRAILSLKHREFLPSVHFDEPNPMIDFENSAVFVNRDLRKWETEAGQSRFAGVTSLGASGTNCHVLLQEANGASERPPEPAEARPRIVAVSSRTAEGLARSLAALRAQLADGRQRSLRDISHTLNAGRDHHEFRFCAVVESVEELLGEIDGFLRSPLDGLRKIPARMIFLLSDPQHVGKWTKNFEAESRAFANSHGELAAGLEGGVAEELAPFAFQFSCASALRDYGVRIENVVAIGGGAHVLEALRNGPTDSVVRKAAAHRAERIADFEQRVARLIERQTAGGPVHFVQVEPRNELTEALLSHPGAGESFRVLALSRDSEPVRWLELLRDLYLAGAEIDWSLFHGIEAPGFRIELPGYQFESTRCWLREQPPAISESTLGDETGQAVVFEGTALEREIAALWEKALGASGFSLDDNFFEAGGDSLKATQLILGINEALGLRLDFEDVFDFPTIREFAAWLEGQRPVADRLSAIWKAVLKEDQILEADSFFELGGHSLMANQVMVRIKRDMGVPIDFEDFYRHPTLGSMARLIEQRMAERPSAGGPQGISKIPEQATYELSAAQKRMWVLSLLEEGTVAYNTPFVFRVQGEIDGRVLQGALQDLLDHYEILRTEFTEVDGEPRQRVLPGGAARIHVEELACETAAEMDALVDRAVATPFDLSRWPLLRVKLVRLGEKESRLLINAHHIITDGWSSYIFLEKLVASYATRKAGLPAPGIEPAIQYKDYAAWQNELLRSGGLERDRNYWLEKLRGPLPVLDLPTDRPRPPVQTFHGACVTRDLALDVCAGLESLCRSRNVTVFAGLLTVSYILLARYAGQQKIIVGTPVAGRHHPDLEDQLGLFVNTLPLLIQGKVDMPLLELLDHVAEVTREAFSHERYPFDRLVDEIGIARDASRSALFDVMVVLQNANVNGQNGEAFALGAARLTPVAERRDASQFDLTFEFIPKGRATEIQIHYNTDLFDHATAGALAERFDRVLDQFIRQSELGLNQVSILTEGEEAVLPAGMGARALDFDRSRGVCEMVAHGAQRYPGAVALVDGSRVISYAELEGLAAKLAAILRQTGVSHESRVGVMGSRCADLIVATLAIWKAQAVYVPIRMDDPLERILGCVRSAEAKWIVLVGDLSDVSELARSLMTDAGVSKIVSPGPLPGKMELEAWHRALGPEHEGKAFFDSEELERVTEAPAPSDYDPRRLAYIIYTSGSTGTPKGAMLEHGGMLNHMFSKIADFGLDRQSIVSQNSPYTFDVSIWQSFCAFLVGGRTVVLRDEIVFSPASFVARMQEERVTVLHCVPSYFQLLLDELEEGRPALDSLEALITSGESLPKKLVERWFALFPRKKLANAYGPTEASDMVTHFIMDKPPATAEIPLGWPVHNVRIYVVDREGGICPTGAYGEICVSGEAVGRGYWNDSEGTKAVFLRNPFGWPEERFYRTGDIGRWRPEGILEYAGRRDGQVKIRGHRIELGEIEQEMLSIPGVEKGVVLAKPSRDDQELFAFFCSRADVDADLVRSGLARRLPRYMVPAIIQKVDDIPLTPHGKVDKAALTTFATPSAAPAFRVPPRNPTDVLLARVFAQLLSLDPGEIGIEAEFFELGGNSLKAIAMISQIQKATGKALSLREVFARPRLADLSEHLARMDKGEIPEIPAAPSMSGYPVASAQKRLFAIQQRAPESTVYNVPCAFFAEGDLDPDRVREAFVRMAERHEALRTTFAFRDREVLQSIAATVEPDIRCETRAGAGLEELMEDFVQPFDLDRGPLWRVQLVRTGPAATYVLLDVHHIISDEASVEILMQDFVRTYRGEEMEPLPIRYRDYAVWTRGAAFHALRERCAGYWRAEFLEGEPALEWQTSAPAAELAEFEGASVSFELDRELAARLKAQTGRGMTMFHLLLSAYSVFLRKCTGSEDMVIGVPVSTRDRHELMGVMGMFVETMPLRLRPRRALAFDAFAGEVKEKFLAAFENRYFSYEDLVAEKESAGHGRRTSVHAAFVMNEPAVDVIELDRVRLTRRPFPQTSAKFDLSLYARDLPSGGLGFEFEYRSDLFGRGTVEGFALAFESFLGEAAAQPTRAVGDFAFGSGAHSFHSPGTSQAGHASLHGAFESWVESSPAAVAIETEKEAVSYRELDRRAEAMAGALRDLGGRRGAVVAVVLDRSIDFLVSVLGILKSGAAYLPISPDTPEARIATILQGSGCPVAIVPDESLSLPEGCRRLVAAGRRRPVGRAPEATVTPRDLAYVIYTSGSTGRPKGVMVEHGGILNTLADMGDRYPCGPGGKVLFKTNIMFDVSVAEIFWALASGGTLVILPHGEEKDPAAVERFIEQRGISCANFVPSAWEGQLAFAGKAGGRGLHSLEHCLIAGEAFSGGLCEQTFRAGLQASTHNLYGPTEASVFAAGFALGRMSQAGAVPIGRPLDNTSALILDGDHLPALQRAGGELCLAGAGLARGYLRAPAMTADKFRPHPFLPGQRLYCTGDFVRAGEAGHLDYVGRMDQQVKLRGFRIELGEIESVMSEFPGVRNPVALVRELRPGDGRRRYLCVYAEGGAPEQELRRFLASRLPEYMMPTAFVWLDSLPKTSSGKIDRRALLAMEPARAPASPDTEGASNATEEFLSAVWKSVLGLDRVPRDENFFSLGGNSLLLLDAFAEIQEKFPAVSIKDLFIHSTIAALASHLKGGGETSASASAPPKARSLSSGEEGGDFQFLLKPRTVVRLREMGGGAASPMLGLLGMFVYLLIQRSGESERELYVRDGEELRVVKVQSAEAESREEFLLLVRQACERGAPAGAGPLPHLPACLEYRSSTDRKAGEVPPCDVVLDVRESRRDVVCTIRPGRGSVSPEEIRDVAESFLKLLTGI